MVAVLIAVRSMYVRVFALCSTKESCVILEIATLTIRFSEATDDAGHFSDYVTKSHVLALPSERSTTTYGQSLMNYAAFPVEQVLSALPARLFRSAFRVVQLISLYESNDTS